MTNFFPHIDGAEKELEKTCRERANKLFGNSLPRSINFRLNSELNSIITYGYSACYIATHKVIKKSKDDGFPVGTRGAIGSSFVAYLLGITEFNPLDYNIPFEIFAGFHDDKAPDIALNFCVEYQEKAKEYIGELLGEKHIGAVGKQDNDFWKLTILGHNFPSILKKLQDLTGVNFESIPLDDEDTLNAFKNVETHIMLGSLKSGDNSNNKFISNLINTTNPCTFNDFVQIFGLKFGSGAWHNNAETLIKSRIATVSEVIANRDNIMINLINKSVVRETAFTIMENTRKGKGLTSEQKYLMSNVGVSDWYIDSCEKIKYIFPKAHCIAYAITEFRMVWFKVHYPNEFDKVINNCYGGD